MIRVANHGTKWTFTLGTDAEVAWAQNEELTRGKKFHTNPQNGAEVVLRMRSAGFDVRPEPDADVS